jgi:four helix bundle protein
MVYQKARRYNQLVRPLIAQVARRSPRQADDLQRAGASLQHNIGEGASKDRPKSKANYYRIAKGSGEECAAGWEVCIDQGWVREHQLTEALSLLDEIARMLHALILRFDPDPRTPLPGNLKDEPDPPPPSSLPPP